MASINRRDFIKITGTGLAMASMPYFLQGSTINHSSTSNEYFARFGIDEDTIRKVMTEALNSGGDYCDLYFQNTLSNSIRLQDNIVSAASTSVQLGVGIRVIKGNQTGYSFTEDISLSSMKKAARTASGIASGSAQKSLQAFETYCCIRLSSLSKSK